MAINIFSRADWSRLLMPIRYSSCSSWVPAPRNKLSIICRDTSRPSSVFFSSDHKPAPSAPLSLLWQLPAKMNKEHRMERRYLSTWYISHGKIWVLVFLFPATSLLKDAIWLTETVICLQACHYSYSNYLPYLQHWQHLMAAIYRSTLAVY